MNAEEMQNQTMLRDRLAAIAESTPKVDKFIIERGPVTPLLDIAANIGGVETVVDAAALVNTTDLRLTRAEKPTAFDVALLTRNVVEEKGTISNLQHGFDQGAENSGDEGNSGGEDEDE